MAKSYTSTTRGDLTTSIASKIVDLMMAAGAGGAAKKAAAVKAAAKYGVELETMPGEFFAKELLNEIIETVIGKKARQFVLPDEKTQDVIMRGQAVEDPLLGVPAHLRNLPEYQNLASPEEKMFKSRQATTGSKPKGGASSKPVKVKDPKLGVFLTQVADALNKSVSSLNTKLDNTETTIIASEKGIGVIAKQLEHNSDILESKLDAIVDVLNQQVNLAKQKEDKSEIQAKVSKQNLEDNQSGTTRFIPVDGKDEETAKINREENRDEIGATDAQRTEFEAQDRYREPPQAETGGIFSGPDSGYTVELHGDEMVVPLDNNYTQGEPSAVDGKIRQAPEYEMGTPMIPKKTSFTPEVFAKSVVPQVIPEDLTEETEKLKEAMQIPVKSAGIITMGLLNRSLNDMGPLASDVGRELKQVGDAYSDSFGIPNTIVGGMVRRGQLEQKMQMKDLNFSLPNQGGEEEKRQFNLFNPFTWFGGGSGGPGGTTYNRYGGGGTRVERYSNNYGGTGGPGTGGPSGLARGTRGVRAGFTGMNAQGFNAMMQGQGYIPSNKPQILGHGAYSAPTLGGAQRYAGSSGSLGGRQMPGGVVNSIVPGTAPRINFLEPQARVSPEIFNKGRDLATKLQGGAYPNSARANMLRAQITSGSAVPRTPSLRGFRGRNLLTLLPTLMQFVPGPVGDHFREANARMESDRDAVLEMGMQRFNQLIGRPQSAIGPPQVTRPDQVDQRSRDAFYSKMSGAIQNLEPIVLNNSQGAVVPDQTAVSPISSQGDSNLEMFYPSLNQF